MTDIKLNAVERTEFGKGAARRLRRASQIPAVLYGHGGEPHHITLPSHETFLALKHSNALFDIQVDGKSTLAIAREVQRHPVSRDIEHVDLAIVTRGEKVEVDVTVHVTGEAAPGTLVSLEYQALTVSADATKLPEGVEVSVDGRQVGDQIHASDVVLPTGVELVTDPEMLVINVTAQPTAEQVEAELEEAEAEAGIEHDAPESEESAEDDEAAKDEE
ncbi:50S ribosomal protein L25/general stress protein Ctc [Saxibacter everestensis]|uniref:Large ribosomal subunit protein bL25 n=1 Tax=Saxibacter everestensis TaxID=2909229 RepID=A0ABY8QQX2_9MICO|nr:50S ribosomal protein L25/general stress protein Ctc [Brevibacteriaceae bacterium ZFBP1038]